MRHMGTWATEPLSVCSRCPRKMLNQGPARTILGLADKCVDTELTFCSLSKKQPEGEVVVVRCEAAFLSSHTRLLVGLAPADTGLYLSKPQSLKILISTTPKVPSHLLFPPFPLGCQHLHLFSLAPYTVSIYFLFFSFERAAVLIVVVWSLGCRAMFVGHARHQKLKRAQVARTKLDAGAGSAVKSPPPEAPTDEVLTGSYTSVSCQRASQKKQLSISHGNVGSNLELTAHNLAAQSAAPASPGSSPPASPRSSSGSERLEVESSGSSTSTGRSGSKKGRSRRNSLNMNAANNSANLITTFVPRTEEQEAFLYQTVEFIRKILAEKLWLQSFMLDYYAVRSEQARKAFCRAILTVFPKPRDALPLIRQAIAVEVSTTGTPSSCSHYKGSNSPPHTRHRTRTRTEDASLLMREGSIMVDLLRMFFLTVGKEQVAAIGPLIKELVRNQVPMEVDPALLDSNKEKSLEQNRLNLISMTQKFLDKIHAAMLSCSRYAVACVRVRMRVRVRVRVVT